MSSNAANHGPVCTQGMEEGMPALCGPAALDPEPSEEVVAVAWSSGGTLVSAYASGEEGAC